MKSCWKDPWLQSLIQETRFIESIMKCTNGPYSCAMFLLLMIKNHPIGSPSFSLSDGRRASAQDHSSLSQSRHPKLRQTRQITRCDRLELPWRLAAQKTFEGVLTKLTQEKLTTWIYQNVCNMFYIKSQRFTKVSEHERLPRHFYKLELNCRNMPRGIWGCSSLSVPLISCFKWFQLPFSRTW